MRRLLFHLLLFFLLAPSPAPGQESPRLATWERFLAGEDELIGRVKALAADLEAGDMTAIGRQFRAGKLRLLFGHWRLPLRLYSHQQAKALLADYLGAYPDLDLHIGLARIEEEPRRAHLVFELTSGQSPSGRPGREHIVAVFKQGDRGWRLAELRCP